MIYLLEKKKRELNFTVASTLSKKKKNQNHNKTNRYIK